METRNGRRIAIVTVLAVIVIAGALLWLGRDHIRFFLAFERLGPNAQGYAEYRHRQTGIVFVSLAGGTFLMGSPEGEEGRNDDEGPVHEVTLSPLMISKYEMTQAQWEKVMGTNPSGFKGSDRPVGDVSWDDCQDFCQRTGLGLPTEAEWEYACRVRTESEFAGTGNVDDMGWYSGDDSNQPRNVGEKAPNAFGLYDMHGNVLECCRDVYDEGFYRKPDATGNDPVCTSGSDLRVMRGGCWFYDAGWCRSASRYQLDPSIRFYYLGFRPVVRLH